jgi:hypothetical protein
LGGYHSFTKLGGHLLDVTAVQIQFPGDLFIGQVQAHKIEAQYPDIEGLMVLGEDRVRQIIEAFLTIFALITLSGRLLLIETSSDHSPGITKRALPALGPKQFTYHVVTLGIIYQISYVYLHAVGFLSGGGKSRLLLYHTTTLESNMSLQVYACPIVLIAAMKEARSGKIAAFDSVADLMADLNAPD